MDINSALVKLYTIKGFADKEKSLNEKPMIVAYNEICGLNNLIEKEIETKTKDAMSTIYNNIGWHMPTFVSQAILFPFNMEDAQVCFLETKLSELAGACIKDKNKLYHLDMPSNYYNNCYVSFKRRFHRKPTRNSNASNRDSVFLDSHSWMQEYLRFTVQHQVPMDRLITKHELGPAINGDVVPFGLMLNMPGVDSKKANILLSLSLKTVDCIRTRLEIGREFHQAKQNMLVCQLKSRLSDLKLVETFKTNEPEVLYSRIVKEIDDVMIHVSRLLAVSEEVKQIMKQCDIETASRRLIKDVESS